MRTDDCEAQGHRKLGGRCWWKDRMLSDMVGCPGDNQQAAKGRAEIRKEMQFLRDRRPQDRARDCRGKDWTQEEGDYERREKRP